MTSTDIMGPLTTLVIRLQYQIGVLTRQTSNYECIYQRYVLSFVKAVADHRGERTGFKTGGCRV